MFLSVNSNTCVSSGLVQIDCLFFSLWIVFSCMPHNLSLNGERPPDIVNFTLLGSGRFLYSCNILRLCYQQSKITFWVLRINGQCIPHYWGNTYLSTSPIAPQIMSLFQSGQWEQAL